MTELDYERMLNAVQEAIRPQSGDPIVINAPDSPPAANDNDAEWPLMPFPEGWHASP